MIIDLDKFLAVERPLWKELDVLLKRQEEDSAYRADLGELRRIHYLYERASADLGKLVTFASEPELRAYLEALVARAYGQIHETRERQHRLLLLEWFTVGFPQAFRRHVRAFWVTVVITIVGVSFGWFAVQLDPDAKSALLPFGHGEMDPAERVKMEERNRGDRLAGHKTTFSGMLMTHNIKVSITTLALGMSYGLGTIILLFYNGVILGGICVDYLMAGQGRFLAGWLLPHGSIEIPAILVAGQAGLILGGALIGWGKRTSLRARLVEVRSDVMMLIYGVSVMLVWAGIIEAFFSQYHEPVLPYTLKILFGLIELVCLAWFLSKSGLKVEALKRA